MDMKTLAPLLIAFGNAVRADMAADMEAFGTTAEGLQVSGVALVRGEEDEDGEEPWTIEVQYVDESDSMIGATTYRAALGFAADTWEEAAEFVAHKLRHVDVP